MADSASAVPPLRLGAVPPAASPDFLCSPRGDPSLVPLELLTRFLDAAQSDGARAARAAFELAQLILRREPTNRLVRDYLPMIEMKLKLLGEEEDEEDEEEEEEDEDDAKTADGSEEGKAADPDAKSCRSPAETSDSKQ